MFCDYRLTPFSKSFRFKSDYRFNTVNSYFKKRKINYGCRFKKIRNLKFLKKISYNKKIVNNDFFSLARFFFLQLSSLSKVKIYLDFRQIFLLSHLLRIQYNFLKKRFKYSIRFRYFFRRKYIGRRFYIHRKRFFKKRYFLRKTWFYKNKFFQKIFYITKPSADQYFYKKNKKQRYKKKNSSKSVIRVKKSFSQSFYLRYLKRIKILRRLKKSIKFFSYRYKIKRNSRLIFFFSKIIFNRFRSSFFFNKKYFLFILKQIRLGFFKRFFFQLNLIFAKRFARTKNFSLIFVLSKISNNSVFRKLKNVIKNSKTRSKRLFFRFLFNRRFNYREKNKRLFKISYQLYPRFYLIDEFFFNSFIISKFIMNLVKNGKKAWARRVTYSLFSFLKYKFNIEIIFLFMRLLSSVIFPYDLVMMRRGKSTQEIPVLLLPSQVVNRTLLIININLRSLNTGSLIIKYFTIFNDYFFLQQGFLFSKMSEYIERVDDLRFLTRKKYSYRLLKNFA